MRQAGRSLVAALSLWSFAVAGAAVEVLDGELLLGGGHHQVDLLLDGRDGRIRAPEPAELAGRIALRAEAPAGLRATVIAGSLRRVMVDDPRLAGLSRRRSLSHLGLRGECQLRRVD